MLLVVLLLALSLSIDALGIGISYGLREISIPLVTKLIISIQSVIITGAALFFGSLLQKILPVAIASHIGVFILILIGVIIIIQGIRETDPKQEPLEEQTHLKKETVYRLLIQSLGITIQIIRTPKYCDFNKSQSIEPMEAVYLGLALSIDAFGAGLGGGAAGFFVPLLPFLTALCQILFLSLGSFAGQKLKAVSNIKDNVWVMFSGFLLIIIGLIRLISH